MSGGLTASGLRAVVADPHHLLRRGIVDVLVAADVRVLADVATADAMMKALVEHRPDVLLVSMTLESGTRHLLLQVRERWPRLAVVAMSSEHSRADLGRALHEGASAHLAQDVAPGRLVETVVQAAAAPGAFLADDVLAARSVAAGSSGPHLTPRESEVLALACEGLTVRQISSRLYVSEATTKSHLAGIYRKLGVSSRAQAVRTASRHGILSP